MLKQALEEVGEHHCTADGLGRIGREHDMAFLQGIGECADERGKQHVGRREEDLQQRRDPTRGTHGEQQCDRCDEQRVIGYRRDELSGNDRVKAFLHGQKRRRWHADGQKSKGRPQPPPLHDLTLA
jgi:hypothetical protein